ncbi:MAG: DNA polymerase III subunit delta [Deltaproteobacteria bacterium]|nr:DNA polymerase III subunit delta [Deltaproteobacteria bacterium]MBW2135931.1 DNA polymerase III subunit delta [Deltaproteobacteria bacterium]
MAKDLSPEEVLKSLEQGKVAPFYLFYGPDGFRLEKVVDRIKDKLIPESARALNLETLYGDEVSPSEVIDRARSLPFLAQKRLIILRRTENYTARDLGLFLPYLENPSESTCLLFLSAKTDFKKTFYGKMRTLGRAVHFEAVREGQALSWMKRLAREMDLRIDGQACAYLHQLVGNDLQDMAAELEKLKTRYGNDPVGQDEVKSLVIHSRAYNIFELMNMISLKNASESLRTLNRFLEEEDGRRAPLQVLGMLNRQLRLLWRAREITAKGGRSKEIAKKLGLMPFSAGKFARQSKLWSGEELERGIRLLHQADGLIKSGSRPKPVLESLIISLCG